MSAPVIILNSSPERCPAAGHDHFSPHCREPSTDKPASIRRVTQWALNKQLLTDAWPIAGKQLQRPPPLCAQMMLPRQGLHHRELRLSRPPLPLGRPLLHRSNGKCQFHCGTREKADALYSRQRSFVGNDASIDQSGVVVAAFCFGCCEFRSRSFCCLRCSRTIGRDREVATATDSMDG
jgi:hypothetical protein